jgi:KaiC/GvpD/RAD55 family RecA-like ATPase
MDGPTYDQLLAVFEAARSNGHGSGSQEWELPTPLIDWTEAYGLGDDPARWLAEPLIPDASAVAIFAKGGTGKSLLALWLAAGLATGSGLTGVCEPVEVLYLDYEMTIRDVVERLEDMGYDDPETLSRLHYASLPTLGPLDTEAGGRSVVEMAEHLKVKLVVVDTFSRAVRGDENEADTVRDWYRWTGRMLKTAGIGFLRIDHAGKDAAKGQRGTSAKNDDVDVVWEMTARDGGEYLLKTIKRRVSWVLERVVLHRIEDHGVMSYRWPDSAPTWLSGTKLVAAQLDELGAPVDISRRKAMVLLRSEGLGRSTNIVADAVRYRREAQDHPSGPLETGVADGAGTVACSDESPQVVPPEDHTGPVEVPDGHRTAPPERGSGVQAEADVTRPDPAALW